MIEASGCIFLSTTTGRIMMQLRSDGVTHARKWGFFGGKSENKERPSETLYREIEEEVGKTNITKVIPKIIIVTTIKKNQGGLEELSSSLFFLVRTYQTKSIIKKIIIGKNLIINALI